MSGRSKISAAQGKAADVKIAASRVRTGAGMGNGDPCPINPDHGKMFVLMPSYRQFCPHSDHAAHKPEPERAMFENDGKTPTKVGGVRNG